MMGIAENIKKRRLELGMSQQELADLVGYKTRSTITRIEAGTNSVPTLKLSKIARALDTTVDYITTGVEEDETNWHLSVNDVCEDKSDKGFGTQNETELGVSGDLLESKNVVVVLAGGKSTRNLQNIPNQFVSVLGKPIIIYCMEAYQNHPSIKEIYVVCLSGWENILKAYARRFGITKLKGVIPAGNTGILSAKNGVEYLYGKCKDNDIVIMQEATRPLVSEAIISKLLFSCDSAVAVGMPMEDTIQFLDVNGKKEYLNRYHVVSLQNPEAYRYSIIKEAFRKAELIGHTFTESCCAMLMYNLNYDLHFVEATNTNLKIVRQEDIVIFTALTKNRA